MRLFGDEVFTPDEGLAQERFRWGLSAAGGWRRTRFSRRSLRHSLTKRHAASTFEGGGQIEEQIEEQMREQNTQNSVKTVLLGTQ
jgi:hypothetical protein